MATPFLKIQTQGLTVTQDSPGSLFIPTVDAAGNPVDVHTGYTVNKLSMSAQSDNNPYFTPVNIASQMTPTFSTTGVTLNYCSCSDQPHGSCLRVVE